MTDLEAVFQLQNVLISSLEQNGQRHSGKALKQVVLHGASVSNALL